MKIQHQCKICPNTVKKKEAIYCSVTCSRSVVRKLPPRPRGELSVRWKGGKIFRSGYIYLLRRDHPFSGKQGYIAEHRLVMEETIGRYLFPGEVVHHINEVPTDNRPENLKLYASPGQHVFQEHLEKLKETWANNKGHIPWNKGGKGLQVAWNKGLPAWNKGKKRSTPA